MQARSQFTTGVALFAVLCALIMGIVGTRASGETGPEAMPDDELAAGPDAQHTSPPLGWNWGAREPMTYTLTETSVEKHNGPSGIINRNTRQVVRFTLHPRSASSDGTGDVVITINGVDAEVELDGERRRFVTGQNQIPADDELLFAFAWPGLFANIEIRCEVTPTGEVTRINDWDGLVERAREENVRQAHRRTDDAFDESKLRAWLTAVLAGPPARDLEPGTTWIQDLAVPSVGFGDMRLKLRHTIASRTDESATFETEGDLELDLERVLGEAEIQRQSASGGMVFDPVEGLIVSRNRSFQVAMSGVFAADLELHADIRRNSTLRNTR